MKVIIAGSRNFNYYNLLEANCDIFINEYKPKDVEVVSGTAKGADKLGELYAKKRNYPVKQFFLLIGIGMANKPPIFGIKEWLIMQPIV